MKILDIADLLGLSWEIFSDSPTDPYLLRIHLTPDKNWWRRRLPGVALNYFFRGDTDREYHNHPWRWSVAFIMWPGYIEWRKDDRYAPVRQFFLRPGMLNFIWKDTYHRVELADQQEGCWTLFIMAPRDWPDGQPSDWGFTTEDGKEYEHQTEREARVKRERAQVA